MIRKTDKCFKRKSKLWERGYVNSEEITEYVRRETWWLFWVIPLYSRDRIMEY